MMAEIGSVPASHPSLPRKKNRNLIAAIIVGKDISYRSTSMSKGMDMWKYVPSSNHGDSVCYVKMVSVE